MRFKPKGRKIYRQKTKFERLQEWKSNTAAVCATVAVTGILVFVGYSVGGPVLHFLQDSNILSVPNEVEETLASTEAEPETTDAPADVPGVVVSAVTEAAVTPAPAIPKMHGYQLDLSALLSQNQLEASVQEIPDGTSHVFVPLKVRGGSIYYATALPDAAQSGAVAAAIPLKTIYDTVAATGAEPVAVINLLEDTTYPVAYPESAYRCEGGEEYWLDAPAENGGKPHISPCSDMTVGYLSNLAAEVCEAGFKSIVCDGLTFPQFSEEDLARLDSRLNEDTRYTGLVKLIESMHTSAPHTKFYVSLSGNDILANRRDALMAAEALDLTAVLCRVDEVSAEHTDILRSVFEKNAVVFIWDGVSPADGEESYVTIAPRPERNISGTKPETEKNPE